MDNATPSTENGKSLPSPGEAAPIEPDWTGQMLGEFRLLHRIGRGGMGQVYLAEQTTLKRKVALKLLNPDLAANERSLLRFKSEAENVARATHGNIVQIYTIGQASGINYLALEYVEGRNLREFIEKKGPPDLALGMHIMSQVAAALQRASELGIIHRDIKPENILLTKKGEVKVADFGLSRCFAEESQLAITQSQVTMGTPLYMSPEQVERKAVDSRTDIYSFGVTCYHMFSGQPPFRGTSPVDVAYQHVHKDPPPLGDIRPDLNPDLCLMIHRMVAKKPEDRYQSAGEIVRAIARLREGLNLASAPSISISSSFVGNSAVAGTGMSYASHDPSKAGQAAWKGVATASVFVALAIGLGFGLYKNHLASTAGIPLRPMPEDDKTPRPPVASADREQDLKNRLSEYQKPEGELDLAAGLNAAIDLGFFYVKERRMADAGQFFSELTNPEQKVYGYRLLGRLGHAFVLSFQDKPEASNQEFLAVLADMEKLERLPKKEASANAERQMAFKLLWKTNLRIREAVARALNRNYANNPTAFSENQPADKLNAYRLPPRPVVKNGS